MIDTMLRLVLIMYAAFAWYVWNADREYISNKVIMLCVLQAIFVVICFSNAIRSDIKRLEQKMEMRK